MAKDSQITKWRGAFGDAYIERNLVTEENIQKHVRTFSIIFAHFAGCRPTSILEVGANVGINLRALKRLSEADLYAVEPNARARQTLVSEGVLPANRVWDATASLLPFEDNSFDLVFTLGVLIHVADSELERAYREIYRVSRRYILSMEYFSPTPVSIPYRGYDDMLFKRDYGSMWLDLFPDLQYLGDGFFWKRTTGLDNVNWWLFRKP